MEVLIDNLDENFGMNFPLRKSIEELIEESQEELLQTINNDTTSNIQIEKKKEESNIELSNQLSINAPEGDLKDFINNNPGLFITCPSCGYIFENGGEGAEGADGLPSHLNEQLTPQLLTHYLTHRFRCRACNSEFCAECKTSPYHSNSLCPSPDVKKCRFCKEDQEAAVNSDVIDEEVYICKKCEVHKPSICIKPGKANPDCLLSNYPHSNCISVSKNEELSSELCGICWVAELSEEPCVSFESCSHVFHRNCFQKQIESGKNSPPTRRLQYPHCLCPLCKVAFTFSSAPSFSAFTEESLKYFDLQRRASHQLSILPSPPSPAAGESEEQLALRLFNFYKCYKCSSVYYGGRQECGVDLEQISASEFLCNGCKGACSQHSGDDLVYKCRFCCSLATYFCFGHTHFCTPCHDKVWGFLDYGHNYQLMRATAAINPCLGGSNCPSGGNHPPNGEEYFVGCYGCQAERLAAEVEEEERLRKKNPPPPQELVPHRFSFKNNNNNDDDNNNNNNNNNNDNNQRVDVPKAAPKVKLLEPFVPIVDVGFGLPAHLPKAAPLIHVRLSKNKANNNNNKNNNNNNNNIIDNNVIRNDKEVEAVVKEEVRSIEVEKVVEQIVVKRKMKKGKKGKKGKVAPQKNVKKITPIPVDDQLFLSPFASLLLKILFSIFVLVVIFFSFLYMSK